MSSSLKWFLLNKNVADVFFHSFLLFSKWAESLLLLRAPKAICHDKQTLKNSPNQYRNPLMNSVLIWFSRATIKIHIRNLDLFTFLHSLHYMYLICFGINFFVVFALYIFFCDSMFCLFCRQTFIQKCYLCDRDSFFYSISENSDFIE